MFFQLYLTMCMLSENIIQNEVHLEDIKITNSRHYSHTFKCALCAFLELNYDNFVSYNDPFPHPPIVAQFSASLKIILEAIPANDQSLHVQRKS